MASSSKNSEIEKLHNELGAAFERALAPLERQGRGLQRDFFSCGQACVAPENDGKPAEDVVRFYVCATRARHVAFPFSSR
jgi:hypothetical protein